MTGTPNRSLRDSISREIFCATFSRTRRGDDVDPIASTKRLSDFYRKQTAIHASQAKNRVVGHVSTKKYNYRAVVSGIHGYFSKSSEGNRKAIVEAVKKSSLWVEAAQRFDLLADQWEAETSLLSSPTRAMLHPAFQEIISMGDTIAVPLILQRMKKRGGHWFWALSRLTGKNPIPKESHGHIATMQNAWIAWGNKRGYC